MLFNPIPGRHRHCGNLRPSDIKKPIAHRSQSRIPARPIQAYTVKMLCLSTLVSLAAAMIIMSSAAPTAQNSTAPYSPKIYVTASGPRVGLYAGVATRQDFRVNGPALVVFDNFNTAALAEDTFLVAITYPDGQVKGGVSVGLVILPARVMCPHWRRAYLTHSAPYLPMPTKTKTSPLSFKR
jgi:hypothetical protein